MFKFWKKNENKNENPDQEVNLESRKKSVMMLPRTKE